MRAAPRENFIPSQRPLETGSASGLGGLRPLDAILLDMPLSERLSMLTFRYNLHLSIDEEVQNGKASHACWNNASFRLSDR